MFVLKKLTFLFCFIWLIVARPCLYACDLDSLPQKIETLKTKIVCNNSSSFYECHNLLTAKEQQLAIIPESPEILTACHQQTIVGLSLLSPGAKALTEVMDGVHAARYVSTLEDFYHHTQMHRKRVAALGLELFRTNPQLFEGLSEAQVKVALEAHDLAKVSAASKAPDGRYFYQAFFQEGYGRSLDRSLVDALNLEDQRLMNDAYRKINLLERTTMSPPEEIARLTQLREKMMRIEKIADYVDRGMSPVSSEEFGRPMQRATEFLNDPADRQLAQQLERRYERIVSGLEYHKPTPAQRLAIRGQIQMHESFVSTLSKQGSTGVSVKAYARHAWAKTQQGFFKTLKILGAKHALRAFLVLDAVGLYFGGMDSLGCHSTPGYHDWVKDPHCVPVVGITPRLVEFLNEPWEIQLMHLTLEDHTCNVIEETYKEIQNSFEIIDCQEQKRIVDAKGLGLVTLTHDQMGKVLEINFEKSDRRISSLSHGKLTSAKLDDAGEVEEVCFHQRQRDLDHRWCTSKKSLADYSSRLANEISNLMHSSSYVLNRASLASCR